MPPDSKEMKLGRVDQEDFSSAGKTTRLVLVPCHAWTCFPIAIFSGMDNSEYNFSLDIICYDRKVSVRITKITSRFGVSWTNSLPHCFWPISTQLIIAILSTGCEPDNFESYNSLKLSFTNIRGIRSNFSSSLSSSNVSFVWMWIFPWIKLFQHSSSMWDKLGWLNWF